MKDDLVFPENATEGERKIKWQQIAEITDNDFGFDTPKADSDRIKFGVRVLMRNDAGEICVVKSMRYDYMQIPGGGIEPGESIIDALRRETREETGFLIRDIQPLGYVVEKRKDIRNKHDWNHAISFVFSASPDREVGTEYMEDEIAEGFQPFWIKLDDFITTQENSEGKIESYSGCFSNRRDWKMAKYFKQLAN